MRYDHLVKHNGILYKAGEEVPVGDLLTPPVVPPADTLVMPPTVETFKGFLDIEDLKTYEPDDLKTLATKLGVTFTDETTHEELAELCSTVEVDIPVNNKAGAKEYKKSDISRMNLENLKILATELGLEVADKTGAALKEEIIAKLEL